MSSKNNIYLGISVAVLATIIWSGNFIIARGVSRQIGPASLAFYRWLTASMLITPFAWKQFRSELPVIRKSWQYLFWTALSGVAIFNTFVYIAGHYTTAINLALIGTTSSPVFSTIMAVWFLKEKISTGRIIGFFLCITGIILLISKGSMEVLASFHFSKGDLWVIAGAFSFAVYSILVRKKPAGITPASFLFVIFVGGTLMLFPFYLKELFDNPVVTWNFQLVGIILYLGAGASVIAFLCWNKAIQELGAARTVLYGNLIPIFSVIEATLFLGEKVTSIHLISGAMVLAGLIIANTSLVNTNFEPRRTK